MRSWSSQARERRLLGRLGREGLFYGADDDGIFGVGAGIEAGDYGAVAIDEELAEIAFDLAGKIAGGFFFGQMLVERRFVVSLDADLGHHRKGDVVRG